MKLERARHSMVEIVPIRQPVEDRQSTRILAPEPAGGERQFEIHRPELISDLFIRVEGVAVGAPASGHVGRELRMRASNREEESKERPGHQNRGGSVLAVEPV